MDTPLCAVGKLTEQNYGDFENNSGTLTLTFSKQHTSASAFKHMCSDLFASGILDGDPAGLPHSVYDDLSKDLSTGLSKNASVSLGENPDHIVITIETEALALVT